jgi:ferrous iron transport protein A
VARSPVHITESQSKTTKHEARCKSAMSTLKPVSELRPGALGVVRSLRGGREFASRVVAMGLTIGAEITIIRNSGSGPIIIDVRDTRLALGRGEAIKIQVEVRDG